jgi:hypothetical protein
MKTDNFCFHMQNRLIQTSQTGGHWYSDTSPLVFPELVYTLGIVALALSLEHRSKYKGLESNCPLALAENGGKK